MYNFIKEILDDRKISFDDIKNVEDKFEIKFPKELVDFLLKYNGAEIYESRIEKNEVSYGIVALIPIKYGRLYVEKIMEWDKRDQIIKQGLIPIANDRGGNTYYVDPTNEEVLFYFSDDIENPRVISNDLNSFLSSIKVYKQ